MQASGTPPPARISLPAVRRKAAARRHRRDIAAIGSPVLAGCAVLTIALAGVLPGSGHKIAPPPGQNNGQTGACGQPTAARTGRSGGDGAALTAQSSVRAPKQFNLLVPYASFGWLPKRECGESGSTSFTEDYLQRQGLTLHTFASGVCYLMAHKPELVCPSIPGYTTLTLHGRAPAVNGHAAYYVQKPPDASLAWQYGPHGWVVLWNNGYKLTTIVRIADGIVFGGSRQQPLKFAVQITKPSVHVDGLVIVHHFYRRSGALLADDYAVFHPGRNQFRVNISVGGKCPSGSTVRHTVINGYRVAYWSGTLYSRKWTSMCVSSAHGLRITMSGPTNPSATSALTVFRHLKILGTNAARWVRQPES